MVTYSLTQFTFTTTTVSFKKTLLKRRSKNAENQQNLGYMELFADETSSVQNHYLDKKNKHRTGTNEPKSTHHQSSISLAQHFHAFGS